MPLTDESSSSGEHATLVSERSDGSDDHVGASYLLIFAGQKSSVVSLSGFKTVQIGRSQSSDIVLSHPGVSRRHAELSLSASGVWIRDLGSQNGTSINGRRITQPQQLLTTDTISIGDVTLVYNAGERTYSRRAAVDVPSLLARLEEEVARSKRFGRTFALLVVKAPGSGDDTSVTRIANRCLRRIDVFAWTAERNLVILLPEVSASEASEAAQRFLGQLETTCNVGIAVFPTDGGHADSLLVSATSAADEERPEPIRLADASGVTSLEIEGREIVLADPATFQAYSLIEKVATSPLPVLICGETGTGKELAARAIHHFSPRSGATFIALNCAAVTPTLAETQLFGHKKGAFTGAVEDKDGVFQSANGGTCFLDEIGELPLEVQAKLLRALETGTVRPLGSLEEQRVDVRIVAATNRDLESEVEAGTFRQDLLFRIRGAMIWLPPLRDRTREIAHLARRFLEEACAPSNKLEIAPDAMVALVTHSWPGNVRELRNTMQFLAATATGPRVERADVLQRLELAGGPAPAPERAPAPAALPDSEPALEFRPLADELREIEIRRISEALEVSGGNKAAAARLLSMPVRTFFARLKKYEIEDPR